MPELIRLPDGTEIDLTTIVSVGVRGATGVMVVECEQVVRTRHEIHFDSLNEAMICCFDLGLKRVAAKQDAANRKEPT